MNQVLCKDCRAWLTESKGVGDRTGQCRRRPPVGNHNWPQTFSFEGCWDGIPIVDVVPNPFDEFNTTVINIPKHPEKCRSVTIEEVAEKHNQFYNVVKPKRKRRTRAELEAAGIKPKQTKRRKKQ